jgi:probable rRNA maturation factor
MAPLEIVVENRSMLEFDEDWVRRLAVSVLESLDCGEGELGITFVPTGEIEVLNREHLGRAGVTDVISFPLDDSREDAGGESLPLLLGDVVVCPEVARDNAAEFGVSFHEEMCRLVIHGILHVRGFDHEDDEGQMAAREEDLVAGLCRGQS